MAHREEYLGSKAPRRATSRLRPCFRSKGFRAIVFANVARCNSLDSSSIGALL